MRLNLHDMRQFIQPNEGDWVDGARQAGFTIYNDPVEVTFRKNDSESRKDLVITIDDNGDWIAVFYKDEKIINTIKI